MSRLKAALGLLQAGALSAACFFAAGTVPLLGVGIAMLTPVPLIAYSTANAQAVPDQSRLALSLGVVMSTVVAVGGLQAGLGYAANFGLATVLIALGLKHRWQAETIAVLVAGAVAVADALMLIVIVGSPGELVAAVQRTLRMALAETFARYRDMGLPVKIDADEREQIVRLLARVSPAITALTAGATALIDLGLIYRLRGRNHLGYELFGKLREWRAPDWLVWIFIAGGFAYLAPLVSVSIAGANLLLCVGAAYLLQGIAIISFFLNGFKVPLILRALVYGLIMMHVLGAVMVAAVGLFDLWFNFRRLPAESGGSAGRG